MQKEFERYAPQREALQREINHQSLMITKDQGVFKKTQAEKDALKEAKMRFKNN